MKRLIVCCDGTWNRADQEHEGEPCPTNVIRMAYRVAKRDGATLQIVCYDQGVGTGNVLDRYAGGASGEGLEDNIHDAYRFLVANYEPGDEIYLFGFSRGAFTARSLSGLIRKCGILRCECIRQYRPALDLYHAPNHPDDPVPKKFREDFSLGGAGATKIKLIGVWDTVGALGIPLRGLGDLKKYQFHDTELSGSVQFAYHALAVDEHRGPFAPALWAFKPKDGQTIEQVWFCGAHSDVGGGYPERGLSDLALEWMMEKARGAGLALDETVLSANPLHPDHRQEPHNSKKGVYRLTPGIDRPIGKAVNSPAEDDPTQSLHESVRKRWDDVPSYRPPSLKDYFKRIGDPRGA